jgi:PilX N-terminal
MENERGSALVITLMLLLILTAIGIYAINTSTTEIDVTLQSKVGRVTLNAAEAGIYFGIDKVPVEGTGLLGTLPNLATYTSDIVATPIFTVRPGYGANLQFQDYSVASVGVAPPTFNVSTRTIAAVVSYGPTPVGTMY